MAQTSPAAMTLIVPIPHPATAGRLIRRGLLMKNDGLTALAYIGAGLTVLALWLAYWITRALIVALVVFTVMLAGGELRRQLPATPRRRSPAGRSGRPVFTTGQMPRGAVPPEESAGEPPF